MMTTILMACSSHLYHCTSFSHGWLPWRKRKYHLVTKDSSLFWPVCYFLSSAVSVVKYFLNDYRWLFLFMALSSLLKENKLQQIFVFPSAFCFLPYPCHTSSIMRWHSLWNLLRHRYRWFSWGSMASLSFGKEILFIVPCNTRGCWCLQQNQISHDPHHPGFFPGLFDA